MQELELRHIPGEYYVNRLDAGAEIPEPNDEFFWSVTRTGEEVSVVSARALPDARVEGPWVLIRIVGTLDFTLTGVLHRLLGPLADAGISVFAISTFDTDYVLVRTRDGDQAVTAWRDSGIPTSRT